MDKTYGKERWLLSDFLFRHGREDFQPAQLLVAIGIICFNMLPHIHFVLAVCYRSIVALHTDMLVYDD